jgi:GAF domain-containing protein
MNPRCFVRFCAKSSKSSLAHLIRIRSWARSASCSEIVVPIFKHGNVVGELDIDSHALAAFSDEDRVFLEEVCKAIAPLL